MPAGLLPIGSDPGGNLICLACAGEKARQVFFWERVKEANVHEGEVVGWGNVLLIAESFPAFLLGLPTAPQELPLSNHSGHVGSLHR